MVLPELTATLIARSALKVRPAIVYLCPHADVSFMFDRARKCLICDVCPASLFDDAANDVYHQAAVSPTTDPQRQATS